jgi:hypothetical protein
MKKITHIIFAIVLGVFCFEMIHDITRTEAAYSSECDCGKRTGNEIKGKDDEKTDFFCYKFFIKTDPAIRLYNTYSSTLLPQVFCEIQTPPPDFSC